MKGMRMRHLSYPYLPEFIEIPPASSSTPTERTKELGSPKAEGEQGRVKPTVLT